MLVVRSKMLPSSGVAKPRGGMAEDPHKRTSRGPSGPRRTVQMRHEPTSHQAALLVVLVGSDAGRRIAVADGVIIGRDVDGRGLVMDEGVSRRHLRVSRQPDGAHLVEDLGSRNGTYVNGQRIEAAPVQSGDKIALGSGTILLFTRNDRYEEQVLRAQKMQALGTRTGDVPHDFDNLLVAIFGNLDYLKSNTTADDAEQCLLEIETAARRAALLTRQLLSVARKRETTREPVDIPALIDEATAVLRRSLPPTVAFHTDVARGLAALGDSAQLMQVLLNIGLNAGHAMPEGGDLTIRGRPWESPTDTRPEGLPAGRYLRIEIEDNGSGMNETALSRAFQPFFSTRPEGTSPGLGLSTAQSVVRDHGGEIEIRSQLGEGTKVFIYLPAVQPSRSHRAAAPQDLAPLRGSVLVIDDELLVRNATARLLQRFGLTVLLAADVDEALPLLAEQPDVVLLSDELRGSSLSTALPLLRQRLPSAQFVVSTSASDTSHTDTLQRLGVDDVLRKPWGARRLWERIWRARHGYGP